MASRLPVVVPHEELDFEGFSHVAPGESEYSDTETYELFNYLERRLIGELEPTGDDTDPDLPRFPSRPHFTDEELGTRRRSRLRTLDDGTTVEHYLHGAVDNATGEFRRMIMVKRLVEDGADVDEATAQVEALKRDGKPINPIFKGREEREQLRTLTRQGTLQTLEDTIDVLGKSFSKANAQAESVVEALKLKQHGPNSPAAKAERAGALTKALIDKEEPLWGAFDRYRKFIDATEHTGRRSEVERFFLDILRSQNVERLDAMGKLILAHEVARAEWRLQQFNAFATFRQNLPYYQNGGRTRVETADGKDAEADQRHANDLFYNRKPQAPTTLPRAERPQTPVERIRREHDGKVPNRAQQTKVIPIKPTEEPQYHPERLERYLRFGLQRIRRMGATIVSKALRRR